MRHHTLYDGGAAHGLRDPLRATLKLSVSTEGAIVHGANRRHHGTVSLAIDLDNGVLVDVDRTEANRGQLLAAPCFSIASIMAWI